MKSFREYTKPIPPEPSHKKYPNEPKREDSWYNPKPDILTRLFQKRMDEFNQKNDERFKADYQEWEDRKNKIFKENSERDEKYAQELRKWEVDKKHSTISRMRKIKILMTWRNKLKREKLKR